MAVRFLLLTILSVLVSAQAVIQRTNCPKTLQAGTVVVAQSVSIQGNSSPVIILACYLLNPAQISINDPHDGSVPIISLIAGLPTSPGGTSGQVQVNTGGTTFGGVTISGDGTLNGTTGQFTLATVNGSPGSCGDANHTPVITTDAQGRITSFSCASIIGTGGAGNSVYGENPSGAVDGVNATFTIAHTPISNSLQVYVNGLRMQLLTDYTLSGTTINFYAASTPSASSIVLVDYRY